MLDDHSRSPRLRQHSAYEEQAEGDLISDLGIFVEQNGLDSGAADSLYEQPEQVQRAILAEGPVTGRNVNAILMSRIRRTKAAHERGGNHSQVASSRPRGNQTRSQGHVGDDVSRFVAENSLDQDAESKLRAQPFEVQQIVIGEGKLTGRNTSAVLGGRIRRTLDGLAQSQQADAISMFCTENRIDPGAEQHLREQDPYVTQAVISEGPCTGRNTSAILLSRIRRIVASSGSPPQPMMWVPMPVAQPFAHAYSNARTQSAWQDSGRYGKSSTSTSLYANEVRAFCVENGVDENGFNALTEAPPHIQQAIMQEGGITGRNKTAILLSRLRRAEAHAVADPVSSFVAENQLDEAAEQRLRELSLPVQQAVLSEGPLAGARNPSAVLFGRIRRVEQNSVFNPPPRTAPSTMRAPPARPRPSSPYGKEIHDFIVANSINEEIAGTLHEADPRIQKRVIEEGAITGRNPSAVLLSRIRRTTF